VSDAAQLRAQLADRLAREGTWRTPAVDRALRAVPRHLFTAATPLEIAYDDRVIRLKDGGVLADERQEAPIGLAV